MQTCLFCLNLCVQKNFELKSKTLFCKALLKNLIILFILSFMPFVSVVFTRDVLNKRKSAARKPEVLIILLLNWEQENRGYWLFEENIQPPTKVKTLSLFKKSFRRLT
jgi:uncharacterized membrane protein